MPSRPELHIDMVIRLFPTQLISNESGDHLGYTFSMIQKEKQRLREKIRTALRETAPASLRRLSADLHKKLEQSPDWLAAKSVAVYSPIPTEPDVLAPWPAEKLLSFPRVAGLELVFHDVRSPNELSPGKFGILEPRQDLPTSSGRWDLILVPGLAFDPSGHRLGRGGGFYDRFLSAHPDVLRAGICYDEQVVAHVPCAPHDLRVDLVITPSAIIQTSTRPARV